MCYSQKDPVSDEPPEFSVSCIGEVHFIPMSQATTGINFPCRARQQAILFVSIATIVFLHLILCFITLYGMPVYWLAIRFLDFIR